MNMTVTPDGTVLLHDPQTTQIFLDALLEEKKLSGEQYNLWIDYITEATEEIINHQETTNSIKELLRAADIDFVLMPAVLKDQKKTSALNFCNSLFVEKVGETVQSSSSEAPKRKYHFITTGTSSEDEKPFYEKFAALFHDIFPNYTMVGIPDMSKFVAHTQGGLHCLTTEEELLS